MSEYTEQEMDELEELDNQQWWSKLDEDALAIEDFLLLSETRWQKVCRLIKDEYRRWV